MFNKILYMINISFQLIQRSGIRHENMKNKDKVSNQFKLKSLQLSSPNNVIFKEEFFVLFLR